MNAEAVPGGERVPGIYASFLKTLALLSMIIDHLGAAVLGTMLSYGIVPSEQREKLYLVYRICRSIGRLAFPIFCFLLVEGFVHTRSKERYALRLLIFAFISDVPYDLAFSHEVFDWTECNVFFTLFFGLMAIWCMDTVMTRLEEKNKILCISFFKSCSLNNGFLLRFISFFVTVFSKIIENNSS